MTWIPEMEELELKRELAKRMGGAEGIERQHAQGRLTVRERIDRLLDSESFEEVGTHNGAATYDDDDRLVSYRPSSTLRGYGRIDGRTVIIEGGDFTMVELSPERDTISISGITDAALRAALIVQGHLDVPLRIIDLDYSFDLSLEDFSTIE